MIRQPDFSCAWIKVERAKEHVGNLATLVQGFLQSNPYEAFPHNEADTGDLVYKVRVLAQPPHWWSAVIGSRDPNEHPLFLLNKLARVDRHQSLSVVGAVSPSVTYDWQKRCTHGLFVMDPSIIKRTEVHLLKSFEHDAVLGDFRFNESEMEVGFKSPPHITFRNEGPAKSRHVLGTLTSIRRHIESVVIPKLERFF